jgi:hypothetical protein
VKKLIFSLFLFLSLLTFSGCSCKLQTKVEKQILKVTGGKFTVKVYSGGKLVAQYKGNGYVWFEETDSKRHTGVVTFKDDKGRIVRVGAFGGLVIVEYE